MIEPQKPSPEDCCGGGCNPCVFDVYEKNMKLYKNAIENNDTDQHRVNGIDELRLTSYSLIDIIQLNHNHRILKFKQVCNEHLWWDSGAHFILHINCNSIKCNRAYTPVKQACQPDEFCVIVKVYNDGVASNYLFSLKIGDETLWRGPYYSYSYCANKCKRLVMIAQGTGIAPFYGIIEQVLSNEDDYTQVILYYCTQSLSSILFRDELFTFNSNWNFTYKIYLGQSCDGNSLKYKEPVTCRKMDSKDLQCLLPFAINDTFLLCGSERFMTSYKKCFSENNVHESNIVTF